MLLSGPEAMISTETAAGKQVPPSGPTVSLAVFVGASFPTPTTR